MTLLYEELATGYGSADVRGPARQYHDIASDAGPLDGWSDLSTCHSPGRVTVPPGGDSAGAV